MPSLVKLTKWFRRRSSKCEKLTDGQTDDRQQKKVWADYTIPLDEDMVHSGRLIHAVLHVVTVG